VLHTETKNNLLKVCVFTGPVLSESVSNLENLGYSIDNLTL